MSHSFSFYGAAVSVTGLHWPPFFIEYVESSYDGIAVKKYTGPDGLLINTIANALNFTFSLLPVASWGEVSERLASACIQ